MSRQFNVEAKLAQAQRLNLTGQPSLALDELLDYFSKSKIKAWDQFNDSMAQLALELSAELSRPIQPIIRKYAAYSMQYSLDTFPEKIQQYIDTCYSHMQSEIDRVQQEENDCKSPLLKTVDLPRLLNDSIVRPAVEFMFTVFTQVLSEIKDKTRRYDSLYHDIMRKAFHFAAKFNNTEYHSKFSTELHNYFGSNNSKDINLVSYIESQFVRYETAIELNSFDTCFYALTDASRVLTKSVPVQLYEKICKAKYDLLKKNGYKLYAAIIHSKLLELYLANKSQLQCDIPFEQLHEIVVIEAATSPLVDEQTYLQSKVKFERFLDIAGESIPSRESLIKRLLEQPTTPVLYDFVKAAEFGTDPFAICDQFLKFQQVIDQHEIYRDFKKDLQEYAALRTIERACLHYTTIHLDELKDMISWMPVEAIEDLIVRASRNSIIPAHLNQLSNFVELIPRGEQSLQPRLSNLNDKLRDIYDHFQRIKKDLPSSLASAVISSTIDQATTSTQKQKLIYMTAAQFDERKKTLKERRNRAKQEKEQKRREAEERERLKQKEIEEEERKHREEEKKKKEEKDKRENEYNYTLTEIKLIARDIDVDVDQFLNMEPQEGEPEHTNTSKSEDLDWIKFKAHQIKVMYIEDIRSQGSIVAEKMTKVKNEYGRNRVHERLAMKLDIEKDNMDSYKKQAQIIPLLNKKQNQLRKKEYEKEMKNFDALKAMVQRTKEPFEALLAEVQAEAEAERQKQQANAQANSGSTGGFVPFSKVQPALPTRTPYVPSKQQPSEPKQQPPEPKQQPPEPQPPQEDKSKEETKITAAEDEKKTESEQLPEQPKEETKEEQKTGIQIGGKSQERKYQPPTSSGKYQPPVDTTPSTKYVPPKGVGISIPSPSYRQNDKKPYGGNRNEGRSYGGNRNEGRQYGGNRNEEGGSRQYGGNRNEGRSYGGNRNEEGGSRQYGGNRNEGRQYGGNRFEGKQGNRNDYGRRDQNRRNDQPSDLGSVYGSVTPKK